MRMRSMMQDDERWRSLSLGAATIMLKNMAGGVDERSPLCINVPPEDDVSREFTPQQTSRLPVPPRSRGRRSTGSFTNPGATTAVLLGDDSVERGLESSYRRLSGRKGAGYDGYADQQLTSSLELSTSSNEFVSIQVCFVSGCAAVVNKGDLHVLLSLLCWVSRVVLCMALAHH